MEKRVKMFPLRRVLRVAAISIIGYFVISTVGHMVTFWNATIGSDSKLPEIYKDLFKNDSLLNITYVHTEYNKVTRPVSVVHYRDSYMIAMFELSDFKPSLQTINIMRKSVSTANGKMYSVAWKGSPGLQYSISDNRIDSMCVHLQGDSIIKLDQGDSILSYHLHKGQIGMLLNDNSKYDIATSSDGNFFKQKKGDLEVFIQKKSSACYIAVVVSKHRSEVPVGLLSRLLK